MSLSPQSKPKEEGDFYSSFVWLANASWQLDGQIVIISQGIFCLVAWDGPEGSPRCKCLT